MNKIKNIQIKNPKSIYTVIKRKINTKEKMLNFIINNYECPKNKLLYNSTKHIDYCFLTIDNSINKDKRKKILLSLFTKILENNKEKKFTEEEKKILNSEYRIKKLFKQDIYYNFKNELIDFIYMTYEFNMKDFNSETIKYIDILTNYISSLV